MVSHKLPTEDNTTQLLFDLLYSTDADATTFNWQIISQMNYLENRWKDVLIQLIKDCIPWHYKQQLISSTSELTCRFFIEQTCS